MEDISECKTFYFVSFFVCVWLKKRRLVVLTVVKPLTIIARAISHKTIYPCKSRARLIRPISLSPQQKDFFLLLSPGSRKSCTNFYEALKAPNPSTYVHGKYMHSVIWTRTDTAMGHLFDRDLDDPSRPGSS